MGLTRAFGRSVVAVVGLLPLAAFALPAPVAAGLGAAQPAVAVGPTVGPERPIAYPVPGTPQRGFEPGIAFGGSVHLVAFQHAGDGDIRAARVDRYGTVVDAPGIRISGGERGWSPTVAFDGVNFLVAWLTENGPVLAARVSPAGRVLDTTGIELSGPSYNRANPAIAFDGTNYLVIWTEFVDGSEVQGDVHGTLVSPAGAVVGATDVRITNAPGLKERPSIAFAGWHYLVVWDHSPGPGPPNVYGTLVTTSGMALDPAGFTISTLGAEPVVTAVGASFFVAWTDGRAATNVYGARLDAAGSVLDPSGIRITTSGSERVAGIASDGTAILVTYQHWTGSSYALRGVRVDATGAVLDPFGFVLPAPTIESTLAFGGDHYLVAGGRYEPIRGTRVTPGGAVLDPAGIAISVGANAQMGPQVESGGADDLVVWYDNRHDGDGRGLYGARVGPDGQILDGTGFPITTGYSEQADPLVFSVAFDGTNFLVVWAEVDGHSIRAARVSGAGVVAERFDIIADPETWMYTPEVAFGGGQFLVVWVRVTFENGQYPRETRGARVTAGGAVLDPSGIRLAASTGPFDVAFGGTDFMVVWQADVDEGRNSDIYGTRVTTAGAVPSPDGFPISTGDGWQLDPQIAWNGSTHLVVWAETDPSGGRPDADILGTRVDGSGVVLDPAGIAISTAPGDQGLPRVAANGPFLVTWNDPRRDLATSDLYATRVDPDGAVAHPDGFPVTTSIYTAWGSGRVAAAHEGGNFTVAYQRYVAEPPYAATRSYLRKVSPK